MCVCITYDIITYITYNYIYSKNTFPDVSIH